MKKKSEPKESELEIFITSSNPLGAFLLARQFSFRSINNDYQVKFEFQGHGLMRAIDDFYQNASIPVQSYLAAFETLRGAVAVARGHHG